MATGHRHGYTLLGAVRPGLEGHVLRWLPRIATLPNLLALSWIFLLWWGERRTFHSAIERCRWENWERWPPGTTPHHLMFIADPQLVDPHTYPGRPWPLSSLTVRYTDRYLARSYGLLQESLSPDTIVFLGDLFDGGREWSTRLSQSPVEAWKKYGEKLWLREYRRFGQIFFDRFKKGGYAPGPGQRGRKVIASLPGNHDLGLGLGIQIPVRDRFNTYFGEGSHVDVVANHTLVSVDTVSLSAKGQTDPATGSQAPGEKIWMPVEDFLNRVQTEKIRATERELRYQTGLGEAIKWQHETSDISDSAPRMANHTGSSFPTILLTHIPLFRPPGTPCGPLREHWPPSAPPKGQSEALEKDDRNAIPVHAGYQYQNVLTPEISAELVEKVGDIAHVFSGDDHDYCEVLHKSYTTSAPSSGGGVKEITVKSMSWAMGIRKPGVLLLSLWNPVDSTGAPLGTKGSGHGAADGSPMGSTFESHMCLLPDQLGIFVRYGQLFVVTTLALSAYSILAFMGIVPARSATQGPLLPTSTPFSPPHTPQGPFASATLEKQQEAAHGRPSHSQSSSDLSAASASSSSSITTTSNHPTAANGHASTQSTNVNTYNTNTLTTRTSSARTRSTSPNPQSSAGYGIPLSQMSRPVSPFLPASGAAAPTNRAPPLVNYATSYPAKGPTTTAFDSSKARHGYSATPISRSNMGLVQIVVYLARMTTGTMWDVGKIVIPFYLFLIWMG